MNMKSFLTLIAVLPLLALGQKKDPAAIEATWNCVNNICVDPGDGNGEYDSYSYCQSYCNYSDLIDGLYGNIQLCIDVVPTKEQVELLEEIEKLSEKNMDECMVRKTPSWKLNSEELEQLQVEKKKNKKHKLNSFRLYIDVTKDYDQLKIIGFSRNYAPLTTEHSFAGFFNLPLEQPQPERYWFVPLISYENILSDTKFNEVTQTLIQLIEGHLSNLDTATSFKTASFSGINQFVVLHKDIYSFTSPEMTVFADPYDIKTKFDPWVPNRIMAEKYGRTWDLPLFPNPTEMLFALKFELVRENFKPGDHKHHPYYMTNIMFRVDYDYIGLRFNINDKIHTFWAEKNLIHKYNKERPDGLFAESMKLFYKTALRSSFQKSFKRLD